MNLLRPPAKQMHLSFTRRAQFINRKEVATCLNGEHEQDAWGFPGLWRWKVLNRNEA